MAQLGLNDLRHDMNVFTADAAPIGRVKLIRDGDVLIDRSYQRDVYVPLGLIGEVLPDEGRVELTITEEEFDNADWEHPSPV